MNGADVLLLVNTGTAEAPFRAIVGSQRGVIFGERHGEIDESSKDSPAWHGDYGRYESTVSLDELYVPTDDGFLALRDAFRNREKIYIWRQELGIDQEEALAIILEMTKEAPDQEEVTIAVEIKIDGEWSAVGS